MNYTHYNSKRDNKFVQLLSKIRSKYANLHSTEQQIILSDPQKRLEDSFAEMARVTAEQIKSIKFGFSNQISDVESKLFNSQRHLQDYLAEFSNNTMEQIDQVKADAYELNTKMKSELASAQDLLDSALCESMRKISDGFKGTNEIVSKNFIETEATTMTEYKKLQNLFIEVITEGLNIN